MVGFLDSLPATDYNTTSFPSFSSGIGEQENTPLCHFNDKTLVGSEKEGLFDPLRLSDFKVTVLYHPLSQLLKLLLLVSSFS